ncbi:F217B protein, partial [Amia calva]|nr:F217B protein [Amia calva]
MKASLCLSAGRGRRIETLPQPQSEGDKDGGSSGPGKNRRMLSLPLVPPHSDAYSEPKEGQVPSLETLRLYEGVEDDADSASDLSDSERLPVLPSPCTPPQLNLRAEVINPSDFHPYFPGPRGGSHANYSYPDFLPPPFNTWSLRQLALFLNTEGRGAPRPKPVGQLERYLERLLQLEWLQIQTTQAENGKPSAPVSASRQRPHTAPPGHLSLPKSLRQCQRAFPLAFLSCLGNPSASQLSRPACPHCRIHYPFCNGTCRSYAYQRHSRLSPLLERRVGSAVPQKRSSSESRVASSDAGARVQKPGSPSPSGNSHLKRMQAVGNIRNPLPSPGPSIKPQTAQRNNCAGPGVRIGRQRGSMVVKGVDSEKKGSSCGTSGSVWDVSPIRRSGNERQRAAVTAVASWDSKQSCILPSKEPPPVSKGPAKSNGKVKHVQFITK